MSAPTTFQVTGSIVSEKSTVLTFPIEKSNKPKPNKAGSGEEDF